MAAIITPWIDIIHGRLQKGDCALSMTDSTTSKGWLRKTNFKEDFDDPVQAQVKIQIARDHATRYMHQEIRDYSQWFPGIDNNVADALSRDHDLSDYQLTSALKHTYPTQVPENFNIAPLPNEIVSYVTSLLLQLPVQTQLSEKHKTTTLDRGHDGKNTAPPQASPTTSSSHPFPHNKNTFSSEPSPPPLEKAGFLESLQKPWLSRQSELPSITWLRPSGRTVTQTQPKMTMASSFSP